MLHSLQRFLQLCCTFLISSQLKSFGFAPSSYPKSVGERISFSSHQQLFTQINPISIPSHLLLATKNGNNENNDTNLKEPPLTAFLDNVSKTGLDNTRIQRNALVIAKYDVPELGIFADQTYELQEIYFQKTTQEGLVEKVDMTELNLGQKDDTMITKGEEKYLTENVNKVTGKT